ncbi:hypothetical protein FJZ31_22935 [Candidatus Poribacteria bacterium]|nr:hypothetical protein [Candidatus Poribacteria bacterium]
MQKHREIVLIIILSCAMLSCLAEVAVTQNVSVTDYTVPASSSHSLFIDPNYNMTIVADNVIVNKGSIGMVYNSFYESLPLGYSIDATGSGSFEKFAADPGIYKYRNRYSTNAVARFKKYVFKDLFGAVKFGGQFNNKGYDYPATNITVGVGYGRFINATPLRKAVRMEDFLLKENVISDHLPKETMLQLGNIIERQSEYEDNYGETYQKNWFDDMEDAMRKSGLLKKDSIGAIGILRMQEVLIKERIFDRFYGWEVTIGTKIDLTLPQKEQKRPKPSLDISARYSRPINWAIQWNERLSINSPLSNDFGTLYNMNIASDLAYELSNRINFVVRHFISSDKYSQDSNSIISSSLGLSFIYFLENQVNLVVTEQLEKSTGTNLSTNFVVSLNYRIF